MNRRIYAIVYLLILSFSLYSILFIGSLCLFLLSNIVASVILFSPHAGILEGEQPRWDIE